LLVLLTQGHKTRATLQNEESLFANTANDIQDDDKKATAWNLVVAHED
jgi:hypothetical protein